MATDKLSVDLLLNTRKAERELAKLNKEFAKLGKTMGGAFGGPGKGGDKVRALGTGLSKATVKADEFTKSLEASNARVVAFGASAGIIMQIDRAFKGLVTSTMKVEKALLDVNVVLNASTKQLKVFGAEMFKIARGTAQSFEVVAEATTELARQGLGTEKTLKRTNDALILTRLTGMNAADSVKSLTAAVNSFNKEGVTSAQVINRMAKVDAAFAVSSEDLAKSISRVGASAVSAGVSMNELMAITTAVQQKTARGGAVIGNAFKTIFTRIQRTDVLQKLRNIGVAVTDMNGNMLSGMQVIQNLANNFDKLSKSQQASVSESVAGVFQVNILKAAMSDLSSATSHYKGALHAANSATDEAYKRNEQLNQSLDALANRTLANLTQVGASLGGGTLEPAIKRVLSIVNTSMESFGKGGLMEGFGQTWGKGIMKGLGDFIAGPGLVLVVATIGKLFFNLTKFTGKAFADIMGINRAAQQRATIEGAIVDTLSKEPALLSSILSGDTKILTVEQQILATIRKQNIERQAMQIMAAPMASSMMARGVHVGKSGGMSFKGGGRAGGFVPNFADAGSERAAAAAGGYTAGAIRTMHQPGAGTMMYNSAETVKRFPGMSQSAIMPPKGSPAGAGYKSAFGAAHGFDPYAGSGFVPNFAGGRVGRSSFKNEAAVARQKGKPAPVGLDVTVDVSKLRDLGIVTEEGSKTSPISFGQQVMGPKGIPALRNKLPKKMMNGADGKILESLMLRVSPLPVVPIFPIKQNTDEMSNLVGKFPSLQNSLNEYAENIAHQLFPKSKARAFNMDNLSKGTEGDIFEEGLRAAVQEQGLEDRRASFDYSGPEYAHKKLIAFMNKKGANLKPRSTKLEAKIGAEAAISGNIAKKVVNDALAAGMNVGPNINSIVKAIDQKYKATAGGEIGQLTHTGVGGTNQTGRRTSFGKWRGKAMGHIPNFALSPLTSAIGREMQAGVPSSAIRVGSSPSLRSAGNPEGVGVYNTIHEPGGLQQGISRSRAGGVNPKSHGIPNFAGEGLVFPDYSEKRPWKLREIEASEKAKKAEEELAKARKKAGDETGKTTKKSKGFTKGLRGMKIGMGGMAAAQIGSMAMMGAQGAGLTTPGSTGDKLLNAGGAALQWGGTAAMINPVLGAVVGAVAGLVSFLSDAGDAAEDLGEKLDDLSKRETRTSETFGRIAEEMDKIHVSTFGPLKFDKMEEKRNELFAFIKEEYGEGSQYDKIFDLINQATTGKDVLDVLGKSAGIARDEQNRVKLLQSLKEGSTTKSGLRTVGSGGLGAFMVEGSKEAKAAREAALNVGRRSSKEGLQRQKDEILMRSTARKNRIQALGIDQIFRKEFEDLPGFKEKGGFFGDEAFNIPDSLKTKIIDQFGAGGRRFLQENREMGRAQSQPLVVAAKRGDLDLSGLVSAGARGGRSLVQEMAGTGAFQKSGKFFGRTITKNFVDSNQAMAALKSTREGLRGVIDPAGSFGAKDMATKLAALTNLKGDPLAQLVKDIMAEAEKTAKAGTEGDTTKKVLERAITDLLKDDLTGGALDKVLKQRVGFEDDRIKQVKQDIIDSEDRRKKFHVEMVAIDELAAATIEAASETRHRNKMMKQQSTFDVKMEALRKRGKLAVARSTMDPYGVAQTTRGLSLEGEEERFRTAKANAQADYDQALDQVKSGAITNTIKDILKMTLESGTGAAASVIKEKRQGLQGVIDEGPLTAGKLAVVVERLNEIRALAAEQGGSGAVKLTPNQQQKLKTDSEMVDKTRKIIVDYEKTGTQLKDQNDKNKKEIEKLFNLTTEEIGLRFKLNRDLELFNRKLANVLAGKALGFARKDVVAGKISGAGLVSAEKEAIEKRRNDRGLGPIALEQRASLRQGFRGGMTYSDRDYLDELEDGSRQVATTMKSSFADAFKSIASGASSAQDAMAQFAGNILNTISDMSAKMATNMMFAKMGFSEGGHIPRYGGGGVVTGGSGMKDDVLSMMNGGEYVIKKSSAKKIGYDTLNAINSGGVSGFAEGGAQAGGGSMGKMFAVSAAASAASGLVSGQWGKSKKKPWRGQDYGKGRGEYGYFGGPDSDAGRSDSIAGGGRGAQVALNKAYVYYRRDPETGKLVSERVRPTEGKYEVSGALSLLGRLNQDDRQTGRMFGKEQKMGAYSDYLFGETERRKDVMKAHKKQKKGRLISAYMNAAMLIGGSYMMDRSAAGVAAQGWETWQGDPNPGMDRRDLFNPSNSTKSNNTRLAAAGGSMGKSPALLTGGEYVMGADTVRQYGLDFMGELNRGSIPGMANGGPVSRGNQGAVAGMVAGGETNNNVNISINVDKRGNVEAKATQDSTESDNATKENSTKDIENNKDLGKALQSVVLQELIRQQRPGGLLQQS